MLSDEHPSMSFQTLAVYITLELFNSTLSMIEAEVPERKYNVLVFGLERKHLPVPSSPLQYRNFSVFFEAYGTHRRFQEYDGVVVFQGIFEKFESKSNYIRSYLAHEYDTDELDKRKKEAALLLGQGGFLCFLLTEPFIDSDGSQDFKSTDLAKCHLNYSSFYRENFPSRVAHVTPVVDEFKRFLDVFGAASSHFNNHNNALNCRVLAEVSRRPVGLLIERAVFFLPSLLPDARLEAVTEYFQLLVDAVTSVHNKLHQTVPEWVEAYEFDEEGRLQSERNTLVQQIDKIDKRMLCLSQYKSALVHSGPELVLDVSAILELALGVKVDTIDEFREDIKLVGEDGKTIAVCEIKGINRGIKRENINQTDSHRERSGFEDNFPAILIANTNVKSARSISEKDQEVAIEQVKHAAHMKVLIMRTLDLLGLLRLVFAKKKTPQAICALLLSNVGWLRVQGDQVQILTGE